MDHYKSIHPSKYYQDYLELNIRPDGRKLDQFRPTAINSSSTGTTDGSACARIGNTCVFCGIKAELGTPKAEAPDKGLLIVNVELPSLCSSEFKAGPPSDKAQVMTAFINDFMENSEIIDTKNLCISIDKLVWFLYCDIVCFDYDGSVIDACFLSLISALRSVKLPHVDYNNETNEIAVSDDSFKMLNILHQPVCSTFAIFTNGVILSDPCNKEETLSIGIIRIVTDGEELFAVDKRGGVPLTETEIQECIVKAKVRSHSVKNLMNSVSGVDA